MPVRVYGKDFLGSSPELICDYIKMNEKWIFFFFGVAKAWVSYDLIVLGVSPRTVCRAVDVRESCQRSRLHLYVSLYSAHMRLHLPDSYVFGRTRSMSLCRFPCLPGSLLSWLITWTAAAVNCLGPAPHPQTDTLICSCLRRAWHPIGYGLPQPAVPGEDSVWFVSGCGVFEVCWEDHKRQGGTLDGWGW